MGKAKKNSRSGSSQRSIYLQRVGVNVGMVVLLLAGFALALHFTKQYVDRSIVYPTRPPTIILKNRPIWMTDYLAQQIAESIRPAGLNSTFDGQMLTDRVKLL